MDMTVFASFVVMLAVAGAEIGCLFVCSRVKERRAPIAAVVPVRSDDKNLDEKLEYFLALIERGGSSIDRLLLVDFDGTEAQLDFCESFCRSCPTAEIVSSEDIQKKLSEIFAIP